MAYPRSGIPVHPQLLNLATPLNHLHWHPIHTVILFSTPPAYHNPIHHTTIPNLGTTNNIKWSNYKRPNYFLSGVIHRVQQQSNNSIEQLQLAMANQRILNILLPHPRTQDNETTAQSTTEIRFDK